MRPLRERILEIADGTKTIADLATALGTTRGSVNGCVQRYKLHSYIKLRKKGGEPFVPPPIAEREDGLELLAFHRGRWRHVKWMLGSERWSLGYGGPFILDAGRAFAPLPMKPDNAGGFYDFEE
jgi:hypothetical protein